MGLNVKLILIIGLFFFSLLTFQKSKVKYEETAWATLGIYPGWKEPKIEGKKYYDPGTMHTKKMESELNRTFYSIALNSSQFLNKERIPKEFTSNFWAFFSDSNPFSWKNSGNKHLYTITVPLAFISKDWGKNGRDTLNKKVNFTKGQRRLKAILEGKYDSYYKKVAYQIKKSGLDSSIIIRLGHEADIDSYPWSMKSGNHNSYKKAWIYVRNLLKSECPGLRFDYQGNGSFTDPNPADSNKTYFESGYPGDEYVDIIGLDVYDTKDWPVLKKRMETIHSFATSRNKGFSIPEWGLWDFGDNPDFIKNMIVYMNKLPKNGAGRLVYHNYFEGNSKSKHSLEKFPLSKAVFRSYFSK